MAIKKDDAKDDAEDNLNYKEKKDNIQNTS